MGATIGIDTMVLLGAIIWIMSEYLQAREGPEASSVLHSLAMRRIVVGLNLSVAAMVLCAARCGFINRVLLVGLMGLFTWFNTDASYWIWYGFPDEYTLTQGMNHVAAWLLAGIGIAAIIKPKAAAAVVNEDG